MAGGLISLLSTSLGAALIFRKAKSSWSPLQSLTLDFAIGMMVAASAFSLIAPAYSFYPDSNHTALVSVFLLLGILFIQGLGKLIALSLGQGTQRASVFIIAILLHNFPEGIAVGAGGSGILYAIGLQNIPEGLTTALAFATLGLSPAAAFGGAVASGVVEMLGAFAGTLLSDQSALQPLLLALAGGAMMSAAVRELWERVQESQFVKKDFVIGALSLIMLNQLGLLWS